MNILIRADSSSLIGSGHLMRCLTLAERHRKSGDMVTFVCRDLDGNYSKLVKENKFYLVLLPKVAYDENLIGYAKWLTVPQEQDALETVEEIKKLDKVQRVVVDSYAIDEKWEKIVRPYTNEIFVIDDLANRVHDCDFLLDQDLYDNMEQRYNGLVPEHCKKMLGPRYALLREEFYKARENQIPRKSDVRNILIFYGGVDSTDETTKAIKALIEMRDCLEDITVDVIVGANNSQKNVIKSICERPDNNWISYHEQVNNIAEYMCRADLMLGAGGTTMWERCFLGLPSIVTAVAENQIASCKIAHSKQLIDYIGVWNEVTEKDMEKNISQYMNSLKIKTMQDSIKRNFIDLL